MMPLPRETFEYLRDRLGVIPAPVWSFQWKATGQGESGWQGGLPFSIDFKGGDKVIRGAWWQGEYVGFHQWQRGILLNEVFIDVKVVIDVIGHWCGPMWSLHNYGVDLASTRCVFDLASTRCVLSIPPETRVKESLELQIFSSEVEAPIVAHGKEEIPYCSPW